jgi:hypothetical protein
MSTQLQEIITDNAIRSFNQGYSAGAHDTKSRTSAALRELLSSDYVGVFDQDGNTIAMTKEDVIRRIEEVL